MLRKSWVALGVLAVAASVIALSAVIAIGAPGYSVSLTPSKTTVRYGDEITLQPSVVGTSTLALSTMALEKSWDGVNWTNNGLEGLKFEGTTGTVVPLDPQYLVVDDSMLNPDVASTLPVTVYFRAIYKPVGLDGKAIASEVQTSAPTAITIVRNTKVKVQTTVPKKAKQNKAFTIAAQVSPNCGVGTVNVTITKKGFKKVYQLTTDETGYADVRVKLKAGHYNVQEKWLGNVFGVSAKSPVRPIVVR